MLSWRLSHAVPVRVAVGTSPRGLGEGQAPTRGARQ